MYARLLHLFPKSWLHPRITPTAFKTEALQGSPPRTPRSQGFFADPRPQTPDPRPQTPDPRIRITACGPPESTDYLVAETGPCILTAADNAEVMRSMQMVLLLLYRVCRLADVQY